MSAQGTIIGGASPPISPQDQVEFLLKLQRLLRSGETTSTYKYAMLISLADLAVELRDEVIPLELVADKFIALYWQMSVVFPGSKRTDVLTQVTPSSRTPHATVTVLLRDLIATEKTLARAKEKESWAKLWSLVRVRVVQRYVLEALQRNGFRNGRTARELGLSRHQLYRLAKRHGLPCRADR